MMIGETTSNRDLEMHSHPDIGASERETDLRKGVRGAQAEQKIMDQEVEIQTLKDLLCRANSELKYYQSLLPIQRIEPLQMREGEAKEEDEYLLCITNNLPLLRAYEDRITNVENSLQGFREENRQLTEQNKTLLFEHDKLNLQLMRKTKEMQEMNARGEGVQGGSGGDHLGYLIEGFQGEGGEVNDLLENMKKEQLLLLQQLEAYKTRNTLLEKEAFDSAQVAGKFKNDIHIIDNKYYEVKTMSDELGHELQITKNKLHHNELEYQEMEQNKEEIFSRYNKINGELKTTKKSLEHYKEAYAELEIRKSNEVEILEKELNQLNYNNRDIKNKVLLQDRELDDIREMNRKLIRDLEATKADCNQMLKIMEENENKLSLLEEKEVYVRNLEIDAKRQVEEALLKKDQVLLKEKQYQMHISRLEQDKKDEGIEKQNTQNKIIDNMRSKHKTMLEQRDEEMSMLNDNYYKTVSQLEKLKNDYEITASENKKLVEAVNENSKTSTEQYDNYQKTLRTIKDDAAQEIKHLKQDLEETTTEKQRLEKSKREILLVQEKDTDLLKTTQIENTQLKEDNSYTKKRLAESMGSKENMDRELRRVEHVQKVQYNEMKDNYQDKLKRLENSLTDNKEKHKYTESKVFNLLKEQEGITEKWKNEHSITVGYFERLIMELNTQIHRLKNENVQLMRKIPIKEIHEITTTTNTNTFARENP